MFEINVSEDIRKEIERFFKHWLILYKEYLKNIESVIGINKMQCQEKQRKFFYYCFILVKGKLDIVYMQWKAKC